MRYEAVLVGGAVRVLFLTWDGPQQSYLESLFFPIFAGLQAHAIDVEVLQLTWARAAQLEPVAAAAARFHIGYASRHIPEALRKLALPAIVAYGAGAAFRHARNHAIETLFPRSLIPMAMALAATKAAPSLDLVFDADGFMADERIDFGGWKADGLSYRALRGVEAAGVRRARSVICRTERAREILSERSASVPSARTKIHVAPNAKDGALFSPGAADQRTATRARLGIPEHAPWVVYAGTLGPQYCPDLMLQSFALIRQRRGDARFSCFTFQRDALRALTRRHGLPDELVQIETLAPRDLPVVLAAADLGIAIRRDSFSQRGISPIKVGEYLLSGLPVVASPVGDLKEQLGDSEAALLVDPESAGAAGAIADWFEHRVLPERARLRAEARNLGERWFELSRCVEIYARALGRA
jgi:glycosyltransferase involved in cell wall biosynthesis